VSVAVACAAAFPVPFSPVGGAGRVFECCLRIVSHREHQRPSCGRQSVLASVWACVRPCDLPAECVFIRVICWNLCCQRFCEFSASLGVIESVPVFADLVLLETYSFPGQGKGNASTELFVRTVYNSTVVEVCRPRWQRSYEIGMVSSCFGAFSSRFPRVLARRTKGCVR
jgi:hypothetical protein